MSEATPRPGADLDRTAVIRTERDSVPVESGWAPRTWLLPTLTAVLVLLGAAAIIAAAVAQGSSGAAAPAVVAASRSAGTPPSPSLTAFPGATAQAADGRETPISELADSAWVSRIARKGKIPERALAAYAGAALSVASTNPNCRLGWNTLAAIGQVESQHGSIGDAHLDDHGVAIPTIVGIALDGSRAGIAKVLDTDQGRYDGDGAWDHAVGPMQFLPSTWAKVGQDGNRDGAKDINQVDDAALAAALHLCSIGGDLSIARNWISAIAAYNDSVDYNNRVAEAATRYATLR